MDGDVEVIIVFEAGFDPGNPEIVEIDYLDGARFKKKIDEFGCGVEIILSVGPPGGKLESVFPDQANIYIQTTLMTFMRIELDTIGQAYVSNPDLPFVHTLPTMLDEIE
jgi:hypothetical protein